MVCRVAAIFRSLEICFFPPALSDFIISNLLKSHINFCLKLTHSFCEEVVSSLVEPRGWNSATRRESELWLSLSCFPRLNREIKAKRPKNKNHFLWRIFVGNKEESLGNTIHTSTHYICKRCRGRVTSVEGQTEAALEASVCEVILSRDGKMYIFHFVLFEPIPRTFCCCLYFFSSSCGFPRAHPAQAGCKIPPGFLLAVRAGNNSIVRSPAGNQIHLTHVTWPASVEEQRF